MRRPTSSLSTATQDVWRFWRRIVLKEKLNFHPWQSLCSLYVMVQLRDTGSNCFQLRRNRRLVAFLYYQSSLSLALPNPCFLVSSISRMKSSLFRGLLQFLPTARMLGRSMPCVSKTMSGDMLLENWRFTGLNQFHKLRQVKIIS